MIRVRKGVWGKYQGKLIGRGRARVDLDMTFFSCKAVVQESTIYAFPPPIRIAHPGTIRLHDYSAVYDSPSELAFVSYTTYYFSNNNIV